MQIDYQEITQEESREITGGSLFDAAFDAAVAALRRLAGPNV